MRTTDGARREHRLGAAIALLALLVSACTAGASIAPSASPSPTPSPSASPSPSPDVAGLFVASLKAMTRASMVLSAKLEIAGVPVAMEGRYDVSGADHFSTTTMTLGQTKQTTEETTWAGKTYERTNGAPWYEKPATTADDNGLGKVLASIMAAKDMGVETKAGQQLHHLSPVGAALTAKDIGFDGTGTVKLDFFAKDDGTPAIMEFTLDVTQGTAQAPTHVTGTMEMTFTPGADPTIAAPDPIFVTFTSTKGYSFGHPTSWDARTENGWESFGGPNLEWIGSYSTAKGKYTLTSWTAADVYDLKTSLKATIVSNAAGTLGGEPARVVTYTYKDTSGVAIFGIIVDAIHGSNALSLSWESVAGNEQVDAATFSFVAQSFKFTK